MSFGEGDKRIELLNVAGKYVALGSVMGPQRMIADPELLQFGGKRSQQSHWKPIQAAFIQYMNEHTDWLTEVEGPDGYTSLQIRGSKLGPPDEIERILSNFFEARYGENLVKQVVLEEFDLVMERAV